MIDENTIIHTFPSEDKAKEFDRVILVAKTLLQAVEHAANKGPGKYGLSITIGKDGSKSLTFDKE